MLEYFKLGTYLNRDGVYQKHSRVDLTKETTFLHFIVLHVLIRIDNIVHLINCSLEIGGGV